MNTDERIEWFRQKWEDLQLPKRLSTMAELVSTDYFTAPASSKKYYHHCYEGGLFDHSKEVYEELIPKFGEKSAFIIGMFHDLCKVNAYAPNYCKDGKTINSRTPYKTVSEWYCLGHGRASVIRCLEFGISLTQEEKIAIAWHMTYDDYNWKTYRNHVQKVCPNIGYVKLADEKSTNEDKWRREN